MVWLEGSIVGGMDYVLRRNRRSRGVRIRVEDSGEVKVSAPYRVSKKMVDEVVVKHEDWIRRQKRKLKLRKVADPIIDWESKLVKFRGVVCPIKVDKGLNRLVKFDNGVVWVNPPSDGILIFKQVVLNWLKQEARRDLVKRTDEWSRKMKLSYEKLRFGQQRSRWGSYSGSGTLSLNWRLIHFSEEVMDYVVIHELAHIKQANHGRDFWKLVGEFDRNYKSHRQYLKKQRMVVE